MRRVLLSLPLLLTGCVQTWGLAPPPPSGPPPVVERPAPSDAEVERLLALVAELDAALAEVEASIEAGQADLPRASRDEVAERIEEQQDILERRLLLSIAIADLRNAIALRRDALGRGEELAPEPIEKTTDEILAQATRRVQAARERVDRYGAPSFIPGAPPPPPPPPPVVLEERDDEDEAAETAKDAFAQTGGKKRRRGRRRHSASERGLHQAGAGDGLLGLIGAKSKDEARANDRPTAVEGAAVVGADPVDFDVVDALQPQLPSLVACVRERARVMVRARLGTEGRFREVRIVGGNLTPAARACLVDRLERLQLDVPPDGEAMVVSFPLTFDGP